MKKVMFYISSMGKGGAERVLSYLAEYLSKEYEVIILTDHKLEKEYNLPEKVRRITIGDYYGQNILAPFLRKLWREKQIRRIYLHEKPDTAVGFMGKNAVRMLIAVGRQKGRMVSAIRMNPAYEFGKGFYGKIACAVLNKSDCIVCQTKEQIAYFPKSIRRKACVIKNPIGESFCREAFNGTRRDEIVAVGRLDANKNHQLLIRAFQKVHDIFHDAKLTIYGEGERRKELESLIQDLCLQDCVSLPGIIEDVAETIKDAKIYVLTSISEGIPNSLIEAMALGLPIVTTKCEGGAIDELVQHKMNGYVVPNGDCDMLAETLLYLWGNEEVRIHIGKNALQVQELYKKEAICKQWEKCL